VPHVQQYDR